MCDFHYKRVRASVLTAAVAFIRTQNAVSFRKVKLIRPYKKKRRPRDNDFEPNRVFLVSFVFDKYNNNNNILLAGTIVFPPSVVGFHTTPKYGWKKLFLSSVTTFFSFYYIYRGFTHTDIILFFFSIYCPR